MQWSRVFPSLKRLYKIGGRLSGSQVVSGLESEGRRPGGKGESPSARWRKFGAGMTGRAAVPPLPGGEGHLGACAERGSVLECVGAPALCTDGSVRAGDRSGSIRFPQPKRCSTAFQNVPALAEPISSPIPASVPALTPRFGPRGVGTALKRRLVCASFRTLLLLGASLQIVALLQAAPVTTHPRLLFRAENLPYFRARMASSNDAWLAFKEQVADNCLRDWKCSSLGALSEN